MIKHTQKILIIFLFISSNILFAQRIGKIVPDKEGIKFPPHQIGFNLIFTESGFGTGFFYEKNFTRLTRGYVNITISELKSDREFERYDYWGQPYVIGKVNRVLSLPAIFGLSHRLFADVLTDNFRPYITGGAGPDMIVTTPYNDDFFHSFKFAKAHTSVASFVGIGTNIGISSSKLLGIEMRYEFIHIFNGGVETLRGVYKKDFGSFVLMLKIGSLF
jgi:hypothetical protein